MVGSCCTDFIPSNTNQAILSTPHLISRLSDTRGHIAVSIIPVAPPPQVLAVNAAKDATELVAKLRAYHHTAQMKADKAHLAG